MAPLVWDAVGDRQYETGVDRGVIYLPDGRAVPWNGLTSVQERSSREVQSYFMDGVKFLEKHTPSDYAADIGAYTYPPELDDLIGLESDVAGLFFHDQSSKFFSLSYRTKVGNDTEGLEFGYKIHIVYDVMATPQGTTHQTISESPSVAEFSFSLAGVPPLYDGHRPTMHLSIDSTRTDPARFAAMEDLLYGTQANDARLPTIQQLTEIFELYNALVITDNGDGTWTATDLTDSYITMDSPTQFTITDADATYLDADTYSISTTQ